MPELKASGDLFNFAGEVGFQTGIAHGRIGGGVNIGVTAEAELCHGLDVALGVRAAAEAEALLALLLPALRAEGTAFASAGVRLNAQLSPNLFDKIGFTAQAEAQAQASAAGRLAIALDFNTVAAVARNHLSGVGYEILIAFLNELIIEAGVWGKASFAAMANAHLQVNGTLASEGDSRFVITAGAGVGWGGGTGWDFYAGLKFKDVNRFYHTAAHLITDEVVRQARSRLPAGYGVAIELTDLLLPTALVAAFELGQMSALELVRWGSQADQNAAPFGRAFQRQLQRLIIDKMAEAAGLMLARYLDGIILCILPDSLPAAERNALQTQISTLIDELRLGPLDPGRFPVLVDGITGIVEILFPGELRLWRRPLTIAWCALTLGEALRRASTPAAASLDVSVVGAGTLFAGQAQIDTIPQPPTLVRAELEHFFDPAPAQIGPADAVDYLLAIGLAPLLEGLLPDLGLLLQQLTDLLADTVDLTPGDLVEAALRGAAGEDLADTELYLKLRDWMRAAIEQEIVGELLPALRAELGTDEDARLYLDEVVEPSFLLTTNFVFESLDRVVAGGQVPGSAFFSTFTHGLSVLAWRVFSRNVIVVGDILLHHVVTELHGCFRQLHQEVAADPAHPLVTAGADLLNVVSPSLPSDPNRMQEAVHDLFGELLLAGAEAYGPQVWTEARRDKMRFLLIHLLESIDTGLDYHDRDAVAAFFNQLRECYFIPDLVTLEDLGELLLAVTMDELAIMFKRVVPAQEIFFLRLTLNTVENMESQAHAYVEQLAALAREAWELLQYWIGEAERLLAEAQLQAARLATAIDQAGNRLRSDSFQNAVVAEVRSRGLDNAAALARSAPGFDLLDNNGQNVAIGTAQGVFLTVFLGIEPLLRVRLEVLGETADELAAIVEGAVTLPDLMAALAADAERRLEEALVALGISWPEALSLDDVTAAAHEVIGNSAALILTLETVLQEKLAERQARLAADEARAAREAARSQWQAEQAWQEDFLGGLLSVHIHSPHLLSDRPLDNWLYPSEVPLFVEVRGARPGFVRPDAPRRILLALNGQPLVIPAGQWAYDGEGEALLLRATLSAANSALRDGLNALEVSVVDGAEQRQRESVSFAVDTSREPLAGRLEVAGELSQYDAPGNDHANTSEEYVTLRNAGDQGLDLGGWRLEDRAGHRYRFPDYRLEARALVRIRTGSGRDDQENLYWGRNAAVWNNRGDALYLVDAGNVLRAEHVY